MGACRARICGRGKASAALLLSISLVYLAQTRADAPQVPVKGQEIPRDWTYREYRWTMGEPDDVRGKPMRVSAPRKHRAPSSAEDRPAAGTAGSSIYEAPHRPLRAALSAIGRGAGGVLEFAGAQKGKVLGAVAVGAAGLGARALAQRLAGSGGPEEAPAPPPAPAAAPVAPAKAPAAPVAPAEAPAAAAGGVGGVGEVGEVGEVGRVGVEEEFAKLEAEASKLAEKAASRSPPPQEGGDKGLDAGFGAEPATLDAGTSEYASTAFVRPPALFSGALGGLGGKGAACGLRGGRGAPAAAGVRMMGAEGSKQEKDIMEPEGFEKFFAGIFKSIGASPEDMGMARFDRNKFPELYPATLDEFAELLPSDDDWEKQAIRPMMHSTSMQARPLQLVYDGDYNGWTPEAFHAAVDKKGPGVVIAKTVGGAVMGGYNPKGWVGLSEYRGSVAAFLFTWPDGDLTKRPIKLRKTGGSSLACVDLPEAGPTFGMDGLSIPLGGGGQGARCKLGPYYERRPDGSNSLFADDERITGTQLESLRVYVGAYEEGEEIPYDDALPFQLE